MKRKNWIWGAILSLPILSIPMDANPIREGGCIIRPQPEQVITSSMNKFAADFYKGLNKEENLVFSPYSLFSCLSMAYVGARGETASELAFGLRLRTSQEDLPYYLDPLKTRLKSSLTRNSPAVNIADSIWVHQDLELSSEYKNAIATGWDAKITPLNFKNGSSVVNTINSWIATETQNEIEKLFEISDITPDTRMVLTNAVYFKGSWASPFPTSNTYDAPFYKTPDDSKTVKMMEQTSTLPYSEDESAQFLILPIKSEEPAKYGCFFLLPKNSLEEVESKLSSYYYLKSLVHRSVTTRVNAKIPSFSIKTRCNANDILSSLGIKKAFGANADFSGISSTSLKIEKVIHEAVFKLDENGLTAAAATGISMGVTSIQRPPAISFTADHPFLFGIVDLKSGLVLFLGKLNSP